MFKKFRWLAPTRKSYRSFTSEVKYLLQQKDTNKTNRCVLCNLSDSANKVAEDYDRWVVIVNKFPYKRWDWLGVKDHLMIVPHRHVVGLDQLTAEEWQEFSQIVSDYDNKGYSLYLRSQANPIKTIAHQHWHLLKVD